MLRNVFKLKNLSNLISIRNITLNQVKCFTTNIKIATQPIVDPLKEKKRKILMLELDVLRQEGRKAPDPKLLNEQNWEHILNLQSRSARHKYYTFLWKIERKQENRQAKKEIKKIEIANRKEEFQKNNLNNDHLIYALTHNTIFLRLYDSTINLWNNNNLIRAMMFGQKLIIDCSYDNKMTSRECINTAKQIMLLFSENRLNVDPFDIHLCGADRSSVTMKQLKSYIPTLDDPSFPLNVHTEDFTKIFPKEKLVYLTPHCRNELQNYNHDDIYIIGAIVDKMNNEPLSLAKAKKLGLRMAKLPLDRYLQFNSGSGKSLTLNQMVSILLEQKNHGDWNKSLQIVPKRKIVNLEQERGRPKKIDVSKYKFKIEF